MATAGSAERPGRPGRPASAAAGRHRPGSRPGAGSGASPPESDAKKCPACAEGPPGGVPPCARPACAPCRAGRLSGGDERLQRRSDPERSGSRPGRRDGDGRREFFVSPALLPKCSDVLSAPGGKHKLLCEDREEVKRRNSSLCRDDGGRRDDEPGVLSDSENEEPVSRRIRNISAFFRKTKNCAAFISGAQRSQSCTDPLEERGGKMTKVAAQPALMDRVGISHSFTAGILLSSENSRSVSAPITAPDRRLPWRAVVSSSSALTPLGPAPARPERSISPESNDSISEELNHFKPIVCSPCTPPRRLPDGRLVEPTIVKSTPRNLSRGLQKATSYEASPAVLQKWRQIELDRQSLKVSSRATLTSPVADIHRTGGVDDGEAVKTRPAAAGRDADGVTAANKRRLLFDPEPAQRPSVKIRKVPAIRYSSEAPFRTGSDPEPPESGSGVLFGRRRSFSPYTKSAGVPACKLVPKDPQSPRREADLQTTSRRGRKRQQKTKHLDPDQPDRKRSRPGSRDQRLVRQVRQDRALALRLQRQFDRENQAGNGRSSPDAYFLRSWRTNQSRSRRRGLRRSRRISKKH